MSQPPDPPSVLIADDQTDVLEALRLLLKPEGYAIETATTPDGLLRTLGERDFDVLLIDMNYARDTTSVARVSTCSSGSAGTIRPCPSS